jgi:RHS repeat-associated protein
VTYTYDFEDRLLTTSSGVTNVYDGDGNRVSRTVGGVTTKFLVDEHKPTGWPQVAEEAVGGNVNAQYTHGVMRISQRRDSGSGFAVSYYGYDASGSTRQLYDPSGAVSDKYEYDAFGTTVAQTGSTENSYRYRGEQYDAVVQMYYLRARWYIPATGRFLTQDPYEGEDKDPLSQQHYFYADADPVDGIDPSGFANIVENSLASRVGNIVKSAFADFSTGMRGVTLGRVRGGAELAYNTICCLDKTWSVLDLALQATGSPATAALGLIDQVCKLDCKSNRDKGKKFVLYKMTHPDGKPT